MSSPLLDNACYVKAIVLYPVLRLLFPIFQTPRKKTLRLPLFVRRPQFRDTTRNAAARH